MASRLRPSPSTLPRVIDTAVTHADEVLAALAGSVGAARLPDGRMVDEAMAAEARRTLRLRGGT